MLCQKSIHCSSVCTSSTQHGRLAAIRGAFHGCGHSAGLVPCVKAKETVGSNEAIAILLAISQSPANAPPAQCSTAHIHQVLHQNVGGVLGTSASRFQHGEARMHEHHQSSTKDKPSGIQGSTQSQISLLQLGDLVINAFLVLDPANYQYYPSGLSTELLVESQSIPFQKGFEPRNPIKNLAMGNSMKFPQMPMFRPARLDCDRVLLSQHILEATNDDGRSMSIPTMAN